MILRVLAGTFSICRLPPSDPVPDWADGGAFSSVTRTQGELSVVVASGRVPRGVRAEAGWRALEVEGPIPFSATGVLQSLLSPLSGASIPIFAVSTYDTDYLLVGEANLARAVEALRAAGHGVGGAAEPIR